VTLYGEQTIDGVLTEEDRVLLLNQNDPTTNGIYVTSETAWSRAPDFDGNDDMVTGTRVYVYAGDDNSAVYILTTANPIIIDESVITFDVENTLNDSLLSLSALGTAADKIAYTTDVNTWAETPLTSTARSLLDDTSTSEMRTTLGLGTLATQSGTFSGMHSGTSSGTNTGDQTISLTGDVTGSGTGSFSATIANDAVTYAKMQNVSATSRVLGRITSGAGDVEELTGTQFTTLIDIFTSTLRGAVPASGGGTTNFLRADGTWAAAAGTAAGSSGNVQYNNSGVMAGAAGLTYAGSGTNVKATAQNATDKAFVAKAHASAGAGQIVSVMAQSGAGTDLAYADADGAITSVVFYQSSATIGSQIICAYNQFQIKNATDNSRLQFYWNEAGTGSNYTLFFKLNSGSRTFDLSGNLVVSGNSTLSGSNSGDQLTFKTISVSGQSDVVADSGTDTLTLVAGPGCSITTDATTDSITISTVGSADTNFSYISFA
jgi:hypothetical protein